MQSRDIARAQKQAARIRKMLEVPGRDLAAMPVRGSSWSVAEQFDHTLKVATSILSILESENPKVLSRPCSLLGRVVLSIGYIPRGKAKSPERLAGTQATEAELREKLGQLETSLARLAAQKMNRSKVPIVPHPIFGGLTPAQAMRLLVVHTEHHLKIVGTLPG
jgi:hypothetical protein